MPMIKKNNNLICITRCIVYYFVLFTISPYVQSHNGIDHSLSDNVSILGNDSHLEGDYKLARLARERDEAPLALPASVARAISGPANSVGQWGPVVQWSFAFAAAASLPDGRIVAWGGNNPTSFTGGNFTHSAVWDPATGQFISTPNANHSMFCGIPTTLEDGRIIVNGGDQGNLATMFHTSIFDYRTNQWQRVDEMNNPRWYAGSLALPNGRVFTAIGQRGAQYPELWTPGQGWSILSGANLQGPILDYPGYQQNWLPYLHLAPNGLIFHSGPTERMNWIDTDGNGSVSDAQTRNTWYPKYSVGVMYDEGKILVAGGAVDGSSSAVGTNQVKIIDINGATPQQTTQTSMHHSRQFANGVVLPTGEVMVIGGNTSGIEFSDSGTIFTPEIWNPSDGSWRQVADMAVPRNYHSVALLMFDGRVWSGGGGLCNCSADHPDSQVYSPAYLFNDDGSLATRPSITSAPEEVHYGETISVAATSLIERFTMIKMSATTHNLNSDLRFLEVPFATVNNGSYSLDLHSNPDVLTPGYWMLYAIDQQGVPSVAKLLRISSFPSGAGTGEITREWWTTIAGGSVSDLTNSPNYPDNPTGSDTQNTFEAPSNLGDLYGTRMRGFIHPPLTGQYRFWIASDDGGQLLLSNSTDPAGATTVASVPTWAASREWDKLPEQQSTLITLQAGQRYYIEALQKENTGGDNLAVAWQYQDGYRSVIDGQYLSPFVSNDAPIIVDPGNQINDEGDSLSLPVIASDPDGDSLTFSASGLPAGLSINNSTGVIAGTIAAGTAGNYNVSVSISDSIANANVSFAWAVLSNGGFEVDYDFESDQGWFRNPNGDDTATTGLWERANPESTSNNGNTYQLDSTTSGQNALVTGALAGSGVGSHDIDNGKTSIRSPNIFIPLDSQATIAFSYYLAHLNNASNADYLRVTAIGNNSTILLEERGAADNDAANWSVFSGSLNSFAGQTIHLLIEAADNDSGSMVEAAIDDVVITIAENNQPPVIISPGNQTNIIGDSISLDIVASDGDGDSLVYSAINLPIGLSINSTTGIISGILTNSGSFTIELNVSDGRGGADNTSFSWTVNNPPSLVLSPILTSPQPVNSSVNYTAVTTGGLNPRYKWNFGDNSPETAFSNSTIITHSFSSPGRYIVTLIVTDDTGATEQTQFLQLIHAPLTINRAVESMSIIYQTRVGNDRIWNVNPDNASVSVFDAVTMNKVAEIAVEQNPRSLAMTTAGTVWVTNRQSASISIIDASSLSIIQTIPLPNGSRPFGIAADPSSNKMYISLESSGKLLRFDTSSSSQTAEIGVGPNPRHFSINADGSKIYVSRFITPLLPGEDGANPQVDQGGAEVVVINASNMAISGTISLLHSNRNDSENSGRGIPNYLGPMVISPDGLSAWAPSKQDNILRGTLRDSQNLTFETSVRSISSRIDLASQSEDHAARIDHDNGGVAVTGLFDKTGNHFFSVLEGSRQVAVVDNYSKAELVRFDVGRAPQGLALSADGLTLYVHNFMDRSVTVHDLSNLLTEVSLNAQNVTTLNTLNTVANEQLSAQVLTGKQHFYDARDPRLARDSYMSCASCHNDGGHDGRVWDFTQFGEGVRNTIDLNGRGGPEHGAVHWTANFDEVHDFEGQIRNFAGGTGLMTNADFNATSDPLGASKEGLSSDLDALAAYVNSLTNFETSPDRNPDGTLTTNAQAGKTVFINQACATCHSGQGFTDSVSASLHDVGTIKPASGNRIGGVLTGFDTPTLRGLWATAPYLHDGSAASLAEAVSAHVDVSVTTTELNQLVSYLRQIDQQEPAPENPSANTPPSLINPGNQSSVVGNSVTLALSANDPDGDTLVFSTTGLPTGLGIDSNTGVISGSPITSGVTTVTVTVADGNNGSDSATFSWTIDPVTQGNTPPVATNPGNQNSAIGNNVSLLISADDVDGDVLNFSANGLPAGLSIDLNSGIINGNATAIGSSNVTVTVDDGSGGSDTVSFTWTVNTDSSEVVAHYQGDYQTSTPAPGWQYLWNAQGPIGEASNYIAMLSNGSYYDSDGARGLPDATDLAYGSMKSNGGHPGRGIAQGQIDDRYVIAAFTVDRSGDYSIVQSQVTDNGCTRTGGVVEIYANNIFINQHAYGPSATSFDANIGSLVAGDTIYVGAGPNGSDGCDGFVWDYMLERSGASGNSPPILTDPGNQNDTEADTINLTLSASDQDGDTLQFSATGLPPGLSITSSGVVSGTLTTPGLYTVTINVSDGQTGNDSVSISWDVASLSGSQTVAVYQADYTSVTPAQGWSYLWNNAGPIGQASNYTALQWNGIYYDSDGVRGLPDASDLAYGSMRPTGGHAGRGVNQGQAADRFVIAAYQVSQAGNYRIVQSQATHTGCAFGNGSEVRLYVNDTFIQSQSYDRGGQTTFDGTLGTLNSGDTIYVGLGPNGKDGCDSFAWDFTIDRSN